jgi:putative transposase
MREIVQTRIRYGYRRVQIMLRREGWAVSKNLVYRLYREEGLVLRSKRPRRRKMVVHREARCQPRRANEAWSLDFIHDQLGNGEKFRALTVIDVFSHEALAVEVGQRLRGEHVVEVLNRLVRQRGAPKYLFADNGAEFTGHLVDLWAYHHGTRIDFSRPGKPTDNAFIETFNGSLRRMFECSLVRDAGRSAATRRSMEGRIQREPSSHGSWQYPAQRIRFAGGKFDSMKGSNAVGKLTPALDHHSQALQAALKLTSELDHPMGADHPDGKFK